MSLCVPCREEGREQEHHHFLDREDGHGPVPVCRWHFKGLPYPAGKTAKTLPAEPRHAEGEMQGRHSAIDEGQLKAFHARGMTDPEMAEKLGVSVNAIGFQRRKHGLKSNGKPGRQGRLDNNQARVGIALLDSKRAAVLPDFEAPGNGAGRTVQVRVEVLDAMWAGLEPEDKARLVNYLVEARGR